MGGVDSKPENPESPDIKKQVEKQRTDSQQEDKQAKKPRRRPRKRLNAAKRGKSSASVNLRKFATASTDDTNVRSNYESYPSDSTSAVRSAIKRSMKKVISSSESEEIVHPSRRHHPKTRKMYREDRHPMRGKRAWKTGKYCSNPQYSPMSLMGSEGSSLDTARPARKKQRHFDDRRRSKSVRGRKAKSQYTPAARKKKPKKHTTAPAIEVSASDSSLSSIYSDSVYSVVGTGKRGKSRRQINATPSETSINNSSSTSVQLRHRRNDDRSVSSVSTEDMAIRAKTHSNKTHQKSRNQNKPKKQPNIASTISTSNSRSTTDGEQNLYAVNSATAKKHPSKSGEGGLANKSESSLRRTKAKNNSAPRANAKRQSPQMVDACVSPFIFPSHVTEKVAPHRCLCKPNPNSKGSCPCVRRLLMPLVKDFSKTTDKTTKRKTPVKRPRKNATKTQNE